MQMWAETTDENTIGGGLSTDTQAPVGSPNTVEVSLSPPFGSADCKDLLEDPLRGIRDEFKAPTDIRYPFEGGIEPSLEDCCPIVGSI